MSFRHREWAAAYLSAAADVTNTNREIAQRLKISWKSLPTRRGTKLPMGPTHGQVYMALVLNTSNQDLDADCLVSDATNAQIAETCFFASATVESALQDLVSVGFIHRRQRRSRSSLTTIYRIPGNFGQPDATHANNSEESEPPSLPAKRDTPGSPKKVSDGVDVPALAVKIVAALDAAGIEHNCDVLYFEKWITLRLEKVFFFPASLDGWVDGEEKPGIFRLSPDTCISCLAPLLPKVLTCSSIWDAWAITRHPEDLARRLLKLIRGEEVAFGSFGSDIRHRLELAPILEAKISPGSPVWAGIERAENPAAYLNTSMRKKLLKYDEDPDADEDADDDADPDDDADEAEDHEWDQADEYDQAVIEPELQSRFTVEDRAMLLKMCAPATPPRHRV